MGDSGRGTHSAGAPCAVSKDASKSRAARSGATSTQRSAQRTAKESKIVPVPPNGTSKSATLDVRVEYHCKMRAEDRTLTGDSKPRDRSLQPTPLVPRKTQPGSVMQCGGVLGGFPG